MCTGVMRGGPEQRLPLPQFCFLFVVGASQRLRTVALDCTVDLDAGGFSCRQKWCVVVLRFFLLGSQEKNSEPHFFGIRAAKNNFGSSCLP